MNMWIKSADFGPESFLFSSQAKTGPPEKTLALFLACVCMILHEKDTNMIVYWVNSTHYLAAQNATICLFKINTNWERE